MIYNDMKYFQFKRKRALSTLCVDILKYVLFLSKFIVYSLIAIYIIYFGQMKYFSIIFSYSRRASASRVRA